MTQLNNLEGHEATQAVAEANPLNAITLDALSRAYDFLDSALHIANTRKVEVKYADIEVNMGTLTLGLGIDTGYFFRGKIFETTAEKYDSELDEVLKFCNRAKSTEAAKLRRSISELQAKLDKLEGRV